MNDEGAQERARIAAWLRDEASAVWVRETRGQDVGPRRAESLSAWTTALRRAADRIESGSLGHD